MNNEYIVYVIVHVDTARIYVGYSSDYKKRWRRHIEKSKRDDCSYIHRAINKHGVESFEFKVLQSFFSKKEALLAERYWISYFKSNDKEYGYNLTEGGECGSHDACVLGGKVAGTKNLRKWQAEHPDEFLKNQIKNGQKTGKLYGAKRLNEYARSDQGRKTSSEKAKKKVLKIDVTSNKIITTYQSIKDAALEAQIPYSTFWEIIKEGKHIDRFVWRLG